MTISVMMVVFCCKSTSGHTLGSSPTASGPGPNSETEIGGDRSSKKVRDHSSLIINLFLVRHHV